ncbi:type II toxin-antitoxin system HicB family antitoxin [bacterium]|nr:type II toxin-antitoxin system HicB family antitoxin [bacterium]
MQYTVVIYREPDGSYSVMVPALKGCHTCGETLPEAIQMAEEAISGYTECLRARGLPVPRNTASVRVDTRLSPEAMVYLLDVGEPVPVA